MKPTPATEFFAAMQDLLRGSEPAGTPAPVQQCRKCDGSGQTGNGHECNLCDGLVGTGPALGSMETFERKMASYRARKMEE